MKHNWPWIVFWVCFVLAFVGYGYLMAHVPPPPPKHCPCNDPVCGPV
jgi:hypothetical protein